MNKYLIKPFIIMGLIAAAVVILGIALFKTSDTSEKKEEAITSTNKLIGNPLPEITLKDKDGQNYNLGSLNGRNSILFFNEGLMCYPACWDQMAAFGNDQRFNSENIVALSVITDPPRDWQKAIDRMPDLAKAITLFDQGAVSSRKLNVLSLASSMHIGQQPGHTYIMLDKQGIVRDIYDDPNMAVNNDKLFEMISKY